MNIRRIIWAAWWIGTILIVLSWVHVVPIAIGWFGFGISCISVIASVIVNKCWRPPKIVIVIHEDSIPEEQQDEDRQ
jgi:hypothetical protein